MGLGPRIIFGALKTEKSRSSELITPQRKRISERLKRLWEHKTMAYKVYVRPWSLTPEVNTVHAFACTSAKNSRVLAILSKFSAVTSVVKYLNTKVFKYYLNTASGIWNGI